MKHLDITIDLETCSLSSHAAIMQIAAVAWDRFAPDAEHIFPARDRHINIFDFEHPATKPEDTWHFAANIDLTHQFVCGKMDFSQDTCNWWAARSPQAKDALMAGDRKRLDHALMLFDSWIRQSMRLLGADNVTVWCQGTDFDIPILRHAAKVSGKEDCKPAATPRYFIRDCRTVIYEMTQLYVQHLMEDGGTAASDVLNNPRMAYKIHDELPETFGDREDAHGALYDCIRSSWFTWQSIHALSRIAHKSLKTS